MKSFFTTFACFITIFLWVSFFGSIVASFISPKFLGITYISAQTIAWINGTSMITAIVGMLGLKWKRKI